MDRDQKVKYLNALQDFYAAQRHAAAEEIISRLTGAPYELLKYEDIRRRFNVLEGADRQLRDIPLDSIVGSVNRENDFTRKLLPLNRSDLDRWVRVKTMVEDLAGLPPIEVFQVGEVYFIADGHHRASVARELGAAHIQAYVRQVSIPVPITPDDDLEDLILKAEYANFLTVTRLKEIHPNISFKATLPAAYQFFLDQISAHQQMMGDSQKGEVPYQVAVLDWYDKVFLPTIHIIQTRNIQRKFSDRTEIDLYYWIMEYRLRSEQELGWKLTPRDAAQNLTFNYAKSFENRFIRTRKKIYNFFIPEPLEPAVPPGFWRKQRRTDEENLVGLFDTILVTLPGLDMAWNALDAAIFIAKNEHSVINGLTIFPTSAQKDPLLIEQISLKFNQKCQTAGIESRMAVEIGQTTRIIYERSFWADLIVVPLSFPPPNKPLKRIKSGIHTLIRRSASPLLFVPQKAGTAIHSILVAYGGGRMAEEALYMATYLCIRFKMELTIITIGKTKEISGHLHARARSYLESMDFRRVNYIEDQGDPARAILTASQSNGCDLILMGGYESSVISELVFGSTVNLVLNGTDRMVMICH